MKKEWVENQQTECNTFLGQSVMLVDSLYMNNALTTVYNKVLGLVEEAKVSVHLLSTTNTIREANHGTKVCQSVSFPTNAEISLNLIATNIPKTK
nr:hypothetical protein [Brevibacillus brevis]